eukprot:g29540.t1
MHHPFANASSSPPASSSSTSSSASQTPPVSHDMASVELCIRYFADTRTIMTQLYKIPEGTYSEEGPGAAVFTVSHKNDKNQNLEGVQVVRRSTECDTKKLEAMAEKGRSEVAYELEKLPQVIADLDSDIHDLGAKLEQPNRSDRKFLLDRLFQCHMLKGKHSKKLEELRALREAKLSVEVDRIYTRMQLRSENMVKRAEKEVQAVALHNQRVFVVGGASGSGRAALNSVEYLDAGRSEDGWRSDIDPLSCERLGGAATVLKGKLYVVGGSDLQSIWDNAECFSPQTGSWDKLPKMATKRVKCAASFLNGKLWVLGGSDETFSALSSVEVFDDVAKSWSLSTAMNTKRSGVAAAVCNGYLYAIGGHNGETSLSTVERFDLSRNVWEAVAAMNSKRKNCAAAVLNGKLWVMGGSSRDDVSVAEGDDHLEGYSLDTVERFDLRNNRWDFVAPMHFKRTGCAAAVLNGTLYVMGGSDAPNSYLATCERFNLERNDWEAVASMAMGRNFCASAVL